MILLVFLDWFIFLILSRICDVLLFCFVWFACGFGMVLVLSWYCFGISLVWFWHGLGLVFHCLGKFSCRFDVFCIVFVCCVSFCFVIVFLFCG